MIEERKVYYKQLFYIFIAANMAIFFILLFVTHGESASSLLYAQDDQMFMDFFNSLLQNTSNPYENRVIYPPLSNCMYEFMLLFIPRTSLEQIASNATGTVFGNSVLKMQSFMSVFILYVFLTSAVMFFAFIYFKKGSQKEKILFAVTAFFSGPMIFQFERANSIIVAFVFVLFFFILYESQNKVLREIGLLSLAISVGFKIYPVVFLVFLFNKQRYKDFIRTLLYCALFFFVPMFVLYDGFDGIALLFNNISKYDINHGLNTGAQLNFSKMLILPLSCTGISNDTMLAIGDTFRYTLTVVCGFAALFSKSKWKTAALCACVIYGFQGSCATYLLIMFLIPAAMLLDSEKVHSKLTYVYTFLLALIISGPAVINPVTGEWTRFVGTKISSYAILIFTCMLVVSGVHDMCEVFERKMSINKRATLVSFLIFIATTVLGGLVIMPGGLPKRFGFIFGRIDISGIINTAMSKYLLIMLFSIICFAGIIFLLWWLPRDDKYNGIRQFVKFGLVGVSNTFVSLAIYYIFYFIDKDLYLVGDVVGFIISVINAYILNSHFVFKSEEKKTKLDGFKELMKSYVAYGSTSLLGLLLLYVQVNLLGISGIIAPIIKLIVTIPLNYILNKFWTYKKKAKKEN